MSKSALYASNSNAQALAIGDNINFGTINRRFGCACNLSAGNVTISSSGYYDIDTNFTFTATSAGTLTVQLYKDGNIIPGAVASYLVANSDVIAISIPAMIRQTCCYESTITAKISGIDGTFDNAAISIERL